MGDKDKPAPWWGKFQVALDTLSYYRVGPLEIWVTRSSREWRIGTRTSGETDDPSRVVNRVAPLEETPSDDDIVWNRFGFRKTTDNVVLSPQLAPRPLVVRPETAFGLPPKEETTLFVSSPLWIQFELGEPATKVLETVVFRPSDTWFGPSTIEGEICFATRTKARMHPEKLDDLPHRALSAIHIRNYAGTTLNLDRFKLPLPNLSVYAGNDARLWTQVVRLDRRADGDLAELQLGKGPPPAAQPAKQVQGPRTKPEKGLLIKAFGGLFG